MNRSQPRRNPFKPKMIITQPLHLFKGECHYDR
jgi:hypothetical protein